MPISIEPLLPHAIPFLVVLARIGGLMLVAPLLSSSSIPRQVKLLLLVSLTACVYPALPIDTTHIPLAQDLYTLAPLIVCELAVGFAIGLMAIMPLVSVQIGGLMMGQQMGLGIAALSDPTSEVTGDALARTFYLLVLTAFIVAGGLELMVGALLETFARVPLGAYRLDMGTVDLLGALLTASFEVALRVSMPIVIVIFLENIVVGFLMRTIPGLNIMNFGFPLRILLGIGAVIGTLVFVRAVSTADIDRVSDAIMHWVENLGPVLSAPSPTGGTGG